MNRFERGMVVEIEEGVEAYVTVSGVKHPGFPESRTGHPEDWHEAEGGELEGLEFRDHRGNRLAKSVEDRLKNSASLMDKLEASL